MPTCHALHNQNYLHTVHPCAEGRVSHVHKARGLHWRHKSQKCSQVSCRYSYCVHGVCTCVKYSNPKSWLCISAPVLFHVKSSSCSCVPLPVPVHTGAYVERDPAARVSVHCATFFLLAENYPLQYNYGATMIQYSTSATYQSLGFTQLAGKQLSVDRCVQSRRDYF